jgi:hypothetical protein
MPLISFYNPATRYQTVNTIWFFLLLAVPIVLWVLPATFFDEGTSICPSKFFFNIECMGCGITRAVMHMHHFEWDEAIYYNWGVVWVYPFLVGVWALWLYKAVKRHKRFEAQKKQFVRGVEQKNA